MMTGMPHRPGLMTRLAAAMRGEVAATTVEAYRRAGSVAYQNMTDAEQLRAGLADSGGGLWAATPAQASRLLCAWIAFALQSLGDELVDADYRADPRTAGFLPPVTAEQAAAFLGEVGHWSARTMRAAADATYDVTAEIALPVSLPDWIVAEPCPPAHLAAMLAAARAMRDRAEAAMADLARTPPPEGRQETAERLRGIAAEADSVTSFGEALWTPGATAEVHERAEKSLRRGIDAYFLLGQLLASPGLVDRPELAAIRVTGEPLPLPGQPGFDQWCLTDPRVRAVWQEDPVARRAISALWQHDPDPAATLAIASQIAAAAGAGAIAATSGSGPRFYYCCPWSAIYHVRRPVTIGGRRLRPMQEFAFDVSAEGMTDGGEFTRRLITGPFHPTSEVDYCDPSGDD